MSGRILVAHYSRSGHTKQIAEQIARTVGADIEAIVDPTDRSGLLGYLRSGYQASRQRTVEIGPGVRDPSAYDLVVIGTPIWSMSVSPAVRSYLAREARRLPRVAFFCSCGGSGGERAFAQMARVCGKTPAATLIVRESELAASSAAIERFARDLADVVSASRPSAPQVGTSATF